MKTQIIGAGLVASTLTPLSALAQGSDPLFPPNAKPGECYARVFVPGAVEEFSEALEIAPEYEVLTVSDPTYRVESREIIVEPESEELQVIPAKYEWVEESVLVQEASERLTIIPAVFEEVEEKVLVREAFVTWKRGRGLIERIDEATGEIMCRVEVPAEYETVTRRVMVEPARVVTETVPAEYAMVKKRVMVEPARTETVVLPAKSEIVQVKVVDLKADVRKETVPAKMVDVRKTRQASVGRMEWRSVLCETNSGQELISDLQRALKRAGYYEGPIDGIIGRATTNGVEAYQRDRGLPSGRLTMETLKELGVSI